MNPLFDILWKKDTQRKLLLMSPNVTLPSEQTFTLTAVIGEMPLGSAENEMTKRNWSESFYYFAIKFLTLVNRQLKLKSPNSLIARELDQVLSTMK